MTRPTLDLTTPTPDTLRALYDAVDSALLDQVVPFWQRHAPDPVHGGSYNCLDQDGTVFDTTKHMWLQGRLVWMFSKLYQTIDAQADWLEQARSAITFMQTHAVRPDHRVYFALTADGSPVSLQRKIFTECFYALALSEYGKATGESAYGKAATAQLTQILDWAYDWTKVGRPKFNDQPDNRMLAVPMILLNLIEEIAGEDPAYVSEAEECIRSIALHVDTSRQLVREHVGPNGEILDGAHGRVLNPGHVIEAGWFLQHWAQRLGREELSRMALNMTRWSHDLGWDDVHGGLFYFLDADGYSPTALEWDMKLWWPHCEALYAHLLHWNLTGADEDWRRFADTWTYTMTHFPDTTHGEWFGYLNRRGEVTHRFKGGPYKGFFHVPRSLWLMRTLLEKTI